MISSRFPLLLPAIAIATIAICAETNAPNSQPNPYRYVDNWAQLPAGMEFGQVISVDVDSHDNIWVFHRSNPSILEFDPSGKLLKSFGGMFAQAHGMTIDREGNLWVTDAGNRNGKGEQVFKLSQEGKILMTLGKAGVPGDGLDTFNGPADVAIAPNGDIFVADGHNNSRVVKFSKDGTFIKTWGKKGSAPGEFGLVHTLAFDSRGRLFVGDRDGNHRIQIFDQDGKFLDEWRQFGSPSGIYIDKNDVIYVADSDSNTKTNPGWKRGIRIGSAKDGSVTAFIPDTQPNPDDDSPDPRSRIKISVTSGPEGVTADSKGNVYGAEVGPRMLRRYVK